MGLDNTPDLPPFTSPFNYVIIFTISKLCRLKRGGFRLGSCRAISIYGGGRMGLMKYCNRTGCNRLVSVWDHAALFLYTEAGAWG